MGAIFTHLALHVREVDACVRFYSRYCDLRVIASRASGHQQIIWMGKPESAASVVLVLLPGGPGHLQAKDDFSHLGFAVDSREAVDSVAAMARSEGCLVWEPVEEPFPVGYYCGLKDPGGNFVEFSYGQPLGPGAPRLESMQGAPDHR